MDNKNIFKLWINEMNRLATTTQNRFELETAYKAALFIQKEFDKSDNVENILTEPEINELLMLSNDLKKLETTTRLDYVLQTANKIRLYIMQKIDNITRQISSNEQVENLSDNAKMFK